MANSWLFQKYGKRNWEEWTKTVHALTSKTIIGSWATLQQFISWNTDSSFELFWFWKPFANIILTELPSYFLIFLSVGIPLIRTTDEPPCLIFLGDLEKGNLHRIHSKRWRYFHLHRSNYWSIKEERNHKNKNKKLSTNYLIQFLIFNFNFQILLILKLSTFLNFRILSNFEIRKKESFGIEFLFFLISGH